MSDNAEYTPEWHQAHRRKIYEQTETDEVADLRQQLAALTSAVDACRRYFDHCQQSVATGSYRQIGGDEMAVRMQLKAAAREAIAAIPEEEVAQ
jgi:hypothetical protein